MKAVGLQPSSTGMPLGKETGQRVSHYVIPGGRYAGAFEALTMTEWKGLNLESAHREGSRKNKTAFTCPSCDQRVWGKPDTRVVCEPCGLKMRPPAAETSP